MANISCSSCEDIRQTDPNLIVNGFTDTECASLKNDTGLVPSSGHNDCTDLNNLNDCLVGNMETEVDAYDVCDWKTFMKKFIPNVWTTIKAVICAICGLWTNIHNILSMIEKLQCQINYLFQGASFHLGEEYADTSKSYIVAGKGVSFLNVSASGTSSDIGVVYVGGGLARISGSCLFYNSDFTDGDTCYNYDTNAVNPRHSKARKGNPVWNAHDTKPDDGNSKGTELVYEIRVLKSQFPQIERFFSGIALNANGAGYHALIDYFPAGSYAHGQHGQCNTDNGNPTQDGFDSGHLVPNGWFYIQLRISWIEDMNANANGVQYTPNGLLGIRIAQGAVPC